MEKKGRVRGVGRDKAGSFINAEKVGAKEISSFRRHVGFYKPLIFHDTTIIRDLCLQRK